MKAIAKRMKIGKYKIDFPIDNTAADITVVLIVEIDKKEKKYSQLCS